MIKERGLLTLFNLFFWALNAKQYSKECTLHMYPLGTYFAYLTAVKAKDKAIDSDGTAPVANCDQKRPKLKWANIISFSGHWISNI